MARRFSTVARQSSGPIRIAKVETTGKALLTQATSHYPSFAFAYHKLGQCRFTSAYNGGIPSDGKLHSNLLSNLIPFRSTLKDGRQVEVDFFRDESEWSAGMELMNHVIREGRTYTFEEEFTSVDDYRGYFLTHTAFVVRELDNETSDSSNGEISTANKGEVLGCFYIKPNFPGRCSHVCNGGFMTAEKSRGLGVARLMGKVFLQAARDMGYKSSYFNLVFKSNVGSVKLWDSLEFERVTVLKNAGRLKGLESGEFFDTAYGYQYNLEELPSDYLKANDAH